MRGERLEPESHHSLNCVHDWVTFFGPCLKCSKCGAQTTVSFGGESKPIFPPVTNDQGPRTKDGRSSIFIPELNVPFKFWSCPVCVLPRVTWNGNVATCSCCGLKSNDQGPGTKDEPQ